MPASLPFSVTRRAPTFDSTMRLIASKTVASASIWRTALPFSSRTLAISFMSRRSLHEIVLDGNLSGAHRADEVARVVVLAHLPGEESAQMLAAHELHSLEDAVRIHVADEGAPVERRVVEPRSAGRPVPVPGEAVHALVGSAEVLRRRERSRPDHVQVAVGEAGVDELVEGR